MKLWDTETGQCLKRFSNGKIPYVVRFHPDVDKQHIFLAGMSDKKIIQVRVVLAIIGTVVMAITVRHEFGRNYTRI
jgi:hypothetical protein